MADDLTEEQLLRLIDRAERGSLLAEEATLLRTGVRQLAGLLRRFSAAVGAGERKATEIIRYSLDQQMNGFGRQAAMDVLDAMRSAYMINVAPEIHHQSRAHAAAYFDAAAAFRRHIEQQENQ